MSHITVKQNKLRINTHLTFEISTIVNIDFQHDVGTTPLMTHFQVTISNASLDLDGQSNIYYAPEFISGLAKYFLPYATLWSGMMLGKFNSC